MSCASRTAGGRFSLWPMASTVSVRLRIWLALTVRRSTRSHQNSSGRRSRLAVCIAGIAYTCKVYGIVIRMYFLGSEHNPPHIHAIYGEDTAAFDINSGEEIDGSLPLRAAGMVREWIEIHQTELLVM